MKKLFSTILCIMFLISVCSAFAQTYSDVMNGSGYLFTIEKLWKLPPDDLCKEYGFEYKTLKCALCNDDYSLELSTNKLVLLETDEKEYAVRFYFYSDRSQPAINVYYDYDEIPTVIKALTAIKDWIVEQNNHGNALEYNIYYNSSNGTKFETAFKMTSPIMRISIDEENQYIIENPDDLGLIVDYLDNVDDLISYDETSANN